MIEKYRFLGIGTIVLSLVLVGVVSALAPAWPERPILVYVGWTAGGTSDMTTRAVAREMEKKLGQRILVTNVPGALGSIGATQVTRAQPNTYLWFGGAAVHGTWPILGHSEVSWTDFYAFLDVVMPTTIYVLDSSPWKTLQDLIAAIKASPRGRIKYGHPGAGSNGRIFAGLVMASAGVADKVIAIPYRGGREAGRYLLAEEIQFASVTLGDLADWAVAGHIRPLVNLFSEEIVFEGITFPAITDSYPELEPFQVINPYFGIYVPRNTPEPIVIKIAEAFVYAIEQEGFQKIAVKDLAGIWAPKFGLASDIQMSRIESARGWAIFDLGVALTDPGQLGVPRLADWSWPPHERASRMKAWPEQVESLYDAFH